MPSCSHSEMLTEQLKEAGPIVHHRSPQLSAWPAGGQLQGCGIWAGGPPADARREPAGQYAEMGCDAALLAPVKRKHQTHSAALSLITSIGGLSCRPAHA